MNYSKDVILLSTENMSDDPNDESKQRSSMQNNEDLQVQEEVVTIGASLGEETSRDIYDFFRRNRILFHFGSDEDLSRVRKSEHQPETIYVYMTVPPDGGWGWVIVAVSFLCNAIVDGICLTFGRMIPDLEKDLKLDISKVITISSVQNGVYFLVGPVVSAIVNKVGFRPVAMIGGFLSSLGALSGSFCKTWVQIVMCYGFIAGWGFGMVFAPANIVVGYYFEKYRALVTGIAICGTGVGTLISSPIYGYLTDNYGWRNALRLQSGLCVVVGIASILFRPLLPIRVAQIKEPETDSASDIESEQSVELDFASYSKFLPSRPQKDTQSTKTIGTFVLEPTAEIIQRLRRYNPDDRRSMENRCVKFWRRILCCRKKSPPPKPATEGSHLNLVLEAPPLFQRDIFYTGSVGNLVNMEPGVGSGQDWRKSRMLAALKPEDPAARINARMSMMHPSKKFKQPPKGFRVSSVILQGLFLLFDVRLFTYLTFRVLVVICFFFVIGSNVPYMFITTHCEDHGMPKKYANWLISVIGVSNTVFRLVAGLTSFFPKIDPMYLSAGMILTSGVYTCLIGVVGQGNVPFQYIFCIVFGMGSAYFNTLRQVIFVRCLGLDNLTNAFGISALVMGIATLLGMPLAGILIDWTQNANAAFLYAGISVIIAGILQACLPFCLKKQQAKKEKEAKKISILKKKKNLVNDKQF